MTRLEIENLRKQFGGLVAVDDLSFDVEDGEILGLIGPNGSGKTTVFNCIMSIYDVTAGTVRFDGTDITGERTHDVVNHGIARVSQESNPVDLLSVGANIKLFTLPNSFSRAFLNSVFPNSGVSDEEIASYAATVGIEDKVFETPDSLAHADVRRLEIAKGLATEPDLLLLDEPFAGMNQQEIRDLSATIEELRDRGLTLIVVDHNMRGLMQLVDRVVVLSNGEKLAEGVPGDIVEDEAVQDAYLAGEQGGL